MRLEWSGPTTMTVLSASHPQTVELRSDGKLHWENGTVWERFGLLVHTKEEMARGKKLFQGEPTYPLTQEYATRGKMTREQEQAFLRRLDREHPVYADLKYYGGEPYLELRLEIMIPVSESADLLDLTTMAKRIQTRYGMPRGHDTTPLKTKRKCLCKKKKGAHHKNIGKTKANAKTPTARKN